MKFDDDILTTTFNVPKEKIKELKDNLPVTPAKAYDSKCLIRCGLSPPPLNKYYTQPSPYKK